MAAGKALITSLVVMAGFIAAVSIVAYNTYNATELPDTIQPELIQQTQNASSQVQPDTGVNETVSTGPTESSGKSNASVEGVIVEKNGLIDIDVGFLKSIKYIYSEEYVKGYIVNVTRVGVEDYCSDCVLLLAIEGENGDVYYVLVYGNWYLLSSYEGDEDEYEEYNVQVLSIDKVEGYIRDIASRNIYTLVEVVESNLEYNGHRIYIGYEIKPYGQNIELVSTVIEEHEDHDD